MTSNEWSHKNTVKIALTVTDRAPRTFALPLKRFSLVIAVIGVMMTWSFVATGLLVYEWLSASESETVVASLPAAALQPDAVNAEESPAKMVEVRSWEPITLMPAQEKVELETGFIASEIVIRKRNDNTLELSFTLRNQDGPLQEGFIWARATLVGNDRKTYKLSSSVNAQIQEDGSANRPSSGNRFAIRTLKKRILQLKGPDFKNAKLVRLHLGAYFVKTESQKVISLY